MEGRSRVVGMGGGFGESSAHCEGDGREDDDV